MLSSNPFEVYLKAELLKFKKISWAEKFLQEVCNDDIKLFDIPLNAQKISEQFYTIHSVENYLLSQSVLKKEKLVHFLSDWRKNDVYNKIKRYSNFPWIINDVSIKKIILQQTEPELGYIFQKHQFSLEKIIEDSELFKNDPYKNYKANTSLDYSICLAIKRGDQFKIFDGIHRAILIAKNGQQIITLCYPDLYH